MLDKRNKIIKTRYDNVSVFLAKAKEIHGDTYDYSLVKEVKNISLKLPIICKVHGVFHQSPDKHIVRKQGCRKCGVVKNGESRRLSPEVIYNNLSKVLPSTVTLELSSCNIKNTYERIKFTCSIHNDFTQTYSHFLNGHHCPKCGHVRGGDNLKFGLVEFIRKSREVHGDKYGYSKSIYIHADHPLIVTCPIHGDFTQIPRNHYNGSKCHKCTNEATRERCVKDVDKFKEDADKVHNKFFNYDKVVYINNKVPVIITCPDHGDFEARPDNHLYGTGCGRCNESRGERKISILFDNLNILYKREFIIPSYKYRYDFYIPELNTLIEYDGILHFKAVDRFGGIDGLASIKERDRNKTSLAKLKGYEIIRITYQHFNALEDSLLQHISHHFKYRYNNKFYKNFLIMVKELGLNIDNVSRKDFIPYLTVNLNKKIQGLSHSNVCQ